MLHVDRTKMKANNNQTGDTKMTTKQIDNLKRLLAEFEREYSVPRELQCERDQTEARWQMAMTFAPFVNAMPALLAERERLREAMTGLLEYVPSDAQLVDGGVAATDTPRNRALLKAHAALEAR
jgi:hypothetical protein